MESVAAEQLRELVLVDVVRRVKVKGPADSPGWWKCLDIETGVEFLARSQWFAKPPDGDDE